MPCGRRRQPGPPALLPFPCVSPGGGCRWRPGRGGCCATGTAARQPVPALASGSARGPRPAAPRRTRVGGAAGRGGERRGAEGSAPAESRARRPLGSASRRRGTMWQPATERLQVGAGRGAGPGGAEPAELPGEGGGSGAAGASPAGTGSLLQLLPPPPWRGGGVRGAGTRDAHRQSAGGREALPRRHPGSRLPLPGGSVARGGALVPAGGGGAAAAAPAPGGGAARWGFGGGSAL